MAKKSQVFIYIFVLITFEYSSTFDGLVQMRRVCGTWETVGCTADVYRVQTRVFLVDGGSSHGKVERQT